MTTVPSGTVTFLFTDIAGSTKLLQALGADRYAELLAGQRRILRDAFVQFGGQEVDTQGDAFFVSFPRASDALHAVIQIQRTLAAHDWPEGAEVRVRMGLHTGEPWLVEEGYVGMDVHRAARIAHTGHGGQVLLSETTAPLVKDELPEGVELLDLGRHRLKDLRRPERLHQLVLDGLPNEFPPLNSLEDLSAVEAQAAADGRPPRQVGASPYRGLAAFQEADAQFFFGREAFTEQLLDVVVRQPLTVVIVGPSGSGKSSTVFAGLLPQLRQNGGWLIVPFRPGGEPFLALAGALLPLLEPDLHETSRLLETQKLAKALQSGEVALHAVVQRVFARQPLGKRLLLVADQFEELFTLCPDPHIQQAFVDELLSAMSLAASNQVSPLAVLLTLRADFMGQAITHRPLADALQEGTLILGPMNQDELRAAIERPAEKQGAAFEAGLVARILADVGEEPGNLPLLEFALAQMWDHMESGWLTHKGYESIGGVSGGLARHAEEVFAELSDSRQTQAERVFLQLIQPGAGTEDTRRVATKDDIGPENWGLVQHLADKRLVVTGQSESGEENVEVVHEALIRGWARLQEWMDQARAFRTWQEGLRAAMRSWETSGQDDGALLRGGPLAQAEDWLEQRRDDLNPAEIEFIGASQYEQVRHQNRRDQRRRLIIGGLAIGLVITLFLSFFAVNQQRIAKENENIAFSRELAAAAISNLTVDAERSALLAIEAAETAKTHEAEVALHEALSNLRILQTLGEPGETIQPRGLAFHPVGRYLAIGRADGTLEIWDTETDNTVIVWPGHDGRINEVAFIPDGTLLASTSDDAQVKLWDTQALFRPEPESTKPSPIQTLTGHDEFVRSLAFSANGDLLVTGGDRTAILWDTVTGEAVMAFSGHSNWVGDVALSPDRSRLAAASFDGSTIVWNAESGQELYRIQEGSVAETVNFISGAPGGVAFSPDGSILAAGSEDGTVRIVEALTGLTLQTLVGHSSDANEMVFTKDGSSLVTSSSDGTAKLWDLNTGQVQFSLAAEAGALNDIVISPECVGPPEEPIEWCGPRLAASLADGTVKIWDISPTGNKELGIVSGFWAHFDPSSDQLITHHLDGSFESLPQTFFHTIWAIPDIEAAPTSAGQAISEQGTLRQIATYTLPQVEALAWAGYPTDDGRFTAIAFADKTIMVVENGTGSLYSMFTATSHEDMIVDLDVSPDGSQVATASFDQSAKIWDTVSGNELHSFDGHTGGVNAVDFIQDGTRLVSGSLDGSAKVWDLKSGSELFTLVGHSAGIWTAQFSLDGKYIVTSSDDTTLKIWDAQNGEELSTIRGHSGTVHSFGLSQDASMLASASLDGTAKIWDLEASVASGSGQELFTFDDHNGPTGAVIFNKDNSRFVSASIWDNRTIVYSLDMDELITMAKAKVTRSLTAQECRQYLHLDECPSN